MNLGGAHGLCFVLALCSAGTAWAQDLEPRRWSHLPSGISVIGAGYGYTEADIFVDPVLRLDEFKTRLHFMAVSYVRSLDLFGKSARIDVVLPYAAGRWEGILNGEYASTRRHGFADSSGPIFILAYHSVTTRTRSNY